MWAWARLQAGTGKSPVFYYTFRQQPPFPAGSVYAGWGASHFAGLWYVFDHLNQSPWNWTAADRKLAEEMSTYWVNFARSGDPNGPGGGSGLESDVRLRSSNRAGWKADRFNGPGEKLFHQQTFQLRCQIG